MHYLDSYPPCCFIHYLYCSDSVMSVNYALPSNTSDDHISAMTVVPSKQLKTPSLKSSLTSSLIDTSRKKRQVSSSPARRKSEKSPLSKEVSKYLNEWVSSPDHLSYPYPNDREKAQLLLDTGIDKQQLTTWFSKYRRKRKLANDVSNEICECTGCDKNVYKAGLCEEHWATSSLKCSHHGCDSFRHKGGVCTKHRTIDADGICECTGCDKNVYKAGVCEEHWATSSRKCSHHGCDSVRHKGGVCTKHRKIDADDICECTGCEKNVHKDGFCEEHWVTSSRKCSHHGCDCFVQVGRVCMKHRMDASRKKEIAKHLPILTESLARIFCRFDYESAQSITSNWDDLKYGDDSDTWSAPLLPKLVRLIATNCLVFVFLSILTRSFSFLPGSF